jgi:membrane complex biogenesis BtpA family protein
MAILDIFKNEKPVIGVVHLKPLPGYSEHKSMEDVLEAAIKDAVKLKEGGVDGIIIENYGDKPYYPTNVPPHIVASFSIIVHEIKKLIDIPIGINVLRNDAISALAIATVNKCDFIRVNVFSYAYITDQGIIEGKAHEIIRYRNHLRSNVKIFADIFVKHSFPLFNLSIETVAKDTYYRCKADAIILTGEETGKEVNIENVLKVKSVLEAPVFIGSGININNIEKYLNIADGFIIGTFFKRDGKIENEVDLERVKKLVNIVNKCRKSKYNFILL